MVTSDSMTSLTLGNYIHVDQIFLFISHRNPKLTGQVFFGGSIQEGGPVKVTKDKELSVSNSLMFYEKVDYHNLILGSASCAIC